MADLTSGLTTFIDKSVEPWRLRVEAIAWASPFRGSGLLVGDTIVIADGVAMEPPAFGNRTWELVGQYGEDARFRSAGRNAGDEIKLWVKRGRPGAEGEVFTVIAPLVERQSWRNADNRELLGPDGPVTMERDGFDGSWMGWAEPFQRLMAKLLDVERRTVSFNGDFEARELVERHGARVALAVERYPGRWSASVKEDYERALMLAKQPQAGPEAPSAAS
ncbi:PDZ domain-containing protein [Glacieibacterium frigidum]|uniref:Uncharacterized protein n=1 Tax=Glacieibacterium frigidum TaxID=2593303 RepID=A0A552UH93_9SPHN|nr:hypothetical protein [Glacieibacterium frigidum]TRW17603.1 hypothetical protein FMM06_05490 [Glacieibacterium frigidum]